MWLRSAQALTASGWKPKTSDSSWAASASQVGMSTQTNPSSRSSSAFRSLAWWSSTPSAATQRTSIPIHPRRGRPLSYAGRDRSGRLAQQAPGGAGAGVGDLHAEGGQLLPQAVGGGEVAGRAGLLAPGDQLPRARGQLRGRDLRQVQPA